MVDWFFNTECKVFLTNNNACDECMKDAPYSWCCRMECGEHELCKNCEAEARKQPKEDCY